MPFSRLLAAKRMSDEVRERMCTNVDAQERVARWLADETVDEETKQEIRALDGKELEERFYCDLSFGTGGLRGLIGVGSNRLNRYTIRRATQGLAAYLLEEVPQAAERGVVIAYDSRRRSAEFALETAAVLNGNGIKAYVFRALRPTPQLSFAVRELKAAAGVVITASHNPPEYNGYKVYDQDGVQVVPRLAAQLTRAIDRVESFAQVRTMPREAAEAAGLFHWLGEEMDDRYLARLQTLLLRPEVVRQMGKEMRIVYTPLHGAGRWPVEQVLRRAGFERLHLVQEQAEPDPDFSTVKTPNPEEPEALAMAMALAEEVEAHLVLGTDPDCDRVGVMVRTADGRFVRLNGNQLGALLLDYILSTRKAAGTLPERGVMIKTIVSSELGRAIADRYGVETIDTLTGFKYIGEQIGLLEGQGKTFIFGYEESFGYLAAPFVRDKDGVMASLLICEMAAWHLQQGRTLADALSVLYEREGVFLERLESLTLAGKDGVAQIAACMAAWREKAPAELAGLKVAEVRDYLKKEVLDRNDGTVRPVRLPAEMPPENVLQFVLEDGSWVALRPSGTEPKLKIYLAAVGRQVDETENKLTRLAEDVMERVRSHV